ncbi:A circularly permuted ATPgrasp family protein [Mycobacterium kansasii]|uniref:A circularly permuted ATPgrasp family protein n=1 Tax=Mycobacterium kansasii TaxID=1768 RepID=A0A1V3WDN6_MYCKA|nr:A circularly permuted ATPgrasp family protein [Mycobacterium kansasii]
MADADHLLDGYRTARAQQALFDLRNGPGTGYDEFVDADGKVRPAWTELADAVAERGRAGLDRLRTVVHSLIDHDGISYTGPIPRATSTAPTAWSPDPGDWTRCRWWCQPKTGPSWRPAWCSGHAYSMPCWRTSTEPVACSPRACCPPSWYSPIPVMCAAPRGSRCRAPTFPARLRPQPDTRRQLSGQRRLDAGAIGAGYALADRRVIAHAIPDLYERIAPRPTTPFAQALRLALIDAAPDVAQDPVVVVLSPGIYSETAFDQAYLATLLGFPLVESADLVVRDGKLWMRSLGTLKRVDVVLRRVDADYADPLDLRADSRLGVVGLVEAQHRGTVTVVNTLGSGILESPGLLRFLPELARRLLGEEPLLPTAAVYWAASPVNARICWPICRRC